MEREENVQEQTHFCLIACSFASKYPNGCVSSRHLSELSGYAASLGMTRAVGELRTSLSSFLLCVSPAQCCFCHHQDFFFFSPGKQWLEEVDDMSVYSLRA